LLHDLIALLHIDRNERVTGSVKRGGEPPTRTAERGGITSFTGEEKKRSVIGTVFDGRTDVSHVREEEKEKKKRLDRLASCFRRGGGFLVIVNRLGGGGRGRHAERERGNTLHRQGFFCLGKKGEGNPSFAKSRWRLRSRRSKEKEKECRLP